MYAAGDSGGRSAGFNGAASAKVEAGAWSIGFPGMQKAVPRGRTGGRAGWGDDKGGEVRDLIGFILANERDDRVSGDDLGAGRDLKTPDHGVGVGQSQSNHLSKRTSPY